VYFPKLWAVEINGAVHVMACWHAVCVPAVNCGNC